MHAPFNGKRAGGQLPRRPCSTEETISGHRLARLLAGKSKSQRPLYMAELYRRGFRSWSGPPSNNGPRWPASPPRMCTPR